MKKISIPPIKAVCALLSLLSLLMMSSHALAKTQEKPLIGILLNDGGKGGYSEYPWYAMRKDYAKVIIQAGGIPVYIGHELEMIDSYIDSLDGIVFTGGDVPSPNASFTTGVKSPLNPKHYPRAAFEFSLFQKAYKKNMPVLGICAGMQHMNVAMGGTLHKNLKKDLKLKFEHRQENRKQLQHSINIVSGSQLHKLVNVSKLRINSNHRAGIKGVAAPLKVSAKAPDGVIEAFEAPDKRFFVGIMWHPEFILTPQEKGLWQGLVLAAKAHRESIEKGLS